MCIRDRCKEGCTETYQGETSGGPTRKYYRLTGAGRERLGALLRQWDALRRALAEIGVN